MKIVTNYLKLALACLAFIPTIATAENPEAPKLKVLIIDGQNNHNWKSTTPVLKDALDSSGVFVATVSTSPPKKSKPEEWAKWQPKFSDYDAVLSNYNGEMWPDAVRKSFVDYVHKGGAFVCVPAANNSFGKWKEYNQIIGVGGSGLLHSGQTSYSVNLGLYAVYRCFMMKGCHVIQTKLTIL